MIQSSLEAGPCFQVLFLEACSKYDPGRTRPQWTHKRRWNIFPETAAETWRHRAPNPTGSMPPAIGKEYHGPAETSWPGLRSYFDIFRSCVGAFRRYLIRAANHPSKTRASAITVFHMCDIHGEGWLARYPLLATPSRMALRHLDESKPWSTPIRFVKHALTSSRIGLLMQLLYPTVTITRMSSDHMASSFSSNKNVKAHRTAGDTSSGRASMAAKITLSSKGRLTFCRYCSSSSPVGAACDERNSSTSHGSASTLLASVRAASRRVSSVSPPMPETVA